jgi:hypothetical protein
MVSGDPNNPFAKTCCGQPMVQGTLEELIKFMASHHTTQLECSVVAVDPLPEGIKAHVHRLLLALEAHKAGKEIDLVQAEGPNGEQIWVFALALSDSERFPMFRVDTLETLATFRPVAHTLSEAIASNPDDAAIVIPGTPEVEC